MKKSQSQVTSPVNIWRSVRLESMVEPSPLIVDIQQRHQARLLASLLMILIWLGSLSAVIQLVVVPNFLPTFFVILAGVGLLLIAYFLSRTRYFQYAGVIAAIVPSIVSYTSLINNPTNTPALFFLPIGVLLSSMFLNMLFTLGIAVVNLVGIFLLPTLNPTWALSELSGLLASNLTISALILIAAQHRDRIEKDRNAELSKSEARFRALAENGVAGILNSNLNGEVLYANETLMHMFGCDSVEEIVTSNITRWYKDPKTREELINKLFIQKMVTSFEVEMLTKSGKTITVLHSTRLAGDILFGTLIDITERKRAEVALRESANKMLGIFSTIGDGIAIANLHGQILEANDAVARMHGFDNKDEFLQTNISQLISETDRERMLLDGQEIAEQGCSGIFEYTLRRKDGRFFEGELRIARLDQTEKELPALIAITRDITERKQAEEKLRESERLLKEVQSIAGLGSYILDFSTGMWESSEVLDRLLGIDTTFIRTQGTWLELIHPDDRQPVVDYLMNEVIPNRIRFDKVFRTIRHNDHAECWVHTLGALEFDDQNQPVRLLGTVLDITERKRAEEALRESERRFRALVEHGADQISLLTPEGNLVYENPTARHPLSYPPGALLGHSFFKLMHPDDAMKAEQIWADVLDQPGISQQIALRLRYADGSWRWIEGTVTNMLSEPAVQAVVINYRDVTERKVAEEAFRESKARYHHILDSMMEGCQIIDFDWRYVYVNEVVALQQAHLKPEELLNHTVMELYPDVENTEVFAVLKRCMEERVPAHIETQFIFPGGRFGWFELSVQPVPEGIFILSTDITERKQAERELQRERDFALQVMNTMGQGLTITGADRRFVYVNEAYARLVGRRQEEIIGKTPLDMTTEENHPILNQVKTRRKAGETNSYETKLLDANGKPIDVLVTGVPRWEEGQVIGSIAVITDLTERKQAEEAIRSIQELFQKSFHASPVSAVLTKLPSRTVIDANPAFEEVFEFKCSELIGKSITEFDLWADASERQRVADMVIQSGRVRDFEFAFKTKSGRLGYGVYYAEVIEQQTENYVLTEVVDITARKQAERKLQLQNQRLKALRDIDTAILTADSVENIVGAALTHIRELIDCRRASLTLMNWEANETLIFDVKTVSESVTPKGTWVPLEPFQEMVKILTKDRIILINDLNMLTNPPPQIQPIIREGLRSSCTLPLFAQNSLIGTFNMLSDIPGFFDEEKINLGREVANQVAIAINQNRLLEELRQLNTTLEDRVQDRTAQLQAANQELDAFSYSVSHDLRTPLRAVDGFSQILIETYGSQLPENAQRYLNHIRQGSVRMGQLINDFLQLSRVTRQELKYEVVNLSELAHNIVEDLKNTAPQRNVEFVIAEGLAIRADARLLQIVMENLLSNAWKYTSKQEQARIEFGSVIEPYGKIAFFIRDNGAGFDMAYAHKLFGAFQRLHSENDFEGIGIGLTTVQRIIARHGGRVWAEGEEDQGATFYFII